MQHPHDEDLELQEVRVHLEVELFRASYYHIFSNFRTLVILLQVDPTSSDELKTVFEGYYKIENTFIFAWFLILDIGHYRWLCGSIRELLPKSKVDYLVRTI
jgi:hypothetical protein